jgi:uncharacterized protein
MSDYINVKVKGVAATPQGFGVFLEHGAKVIAIFVDQGVGTSIAMILSDVRTARPLTHKTIGNILAGLGAKVARVVVNELKDDTFFARAIIEQDNELGRKVVEVDMRPSDAIAIALQQKAPIFVSPSVWEESEDMSWALKQ